jgi:hypothetical protein
MPGKIPACSSTSTRGTSSIASRVVESSTSSVVGSVAEFDAMVARIDQLIDEAGAEIATAGWLPGSDWRGTPFQPIYEKAAREDFGRSAMFFGQLVWYTVMRRLERWGSGRYQVDGRDIGSRMYFRLNGVKE